MREIKFRAWDTVTSKYFWPWPEGFGLFGEVALFDCIGQQLHDSGRGHILGVNDLIIEQFTGLRDRNGREIYEGDIVRDDTFTGRTYIMAVEWETAVGSFVLIRKGWAFPHYFGESSNATDCEVIGNIHETPELLV